jgi:hypothetical protein
MTAGDNPEMERESRLRALGRLVKIAFDKEYDGEATTVDQKLDDSADQEEEDGRGDEEGSQDSEDSEARRINADNDAHFRAAAYSEGGVHQEPTDMDSETGVQEKEDFADEVATDQWRDIFENCNLADEPTVGISSVAAMPTSSNIAENAKEDSGNDGRGNDERRGDPGQEEPQQCQGPEEEKKKFPQLLVPLPSSAVPLLTYEPLQERVLAEIR